MKESIIQILSGLDIHARFRREDDARIYFRVSFWSSRCAVALRRFSWVVGRGANSELLLSVSKTE